MIPALNFVILLGLLTGLWVVSVRLRDASIIDPFWGMGFVVVAWVCVAARETAGSRGLLLAVLTSAWGLRLSGYLLWRNRAHAEEDRRYAAMRNFWGEKFWWVSYWTVFALQGVILWVVSLPLQVGILSPESYPLGPMDVVGSLIWLVGLMFESVGDWQLSRFKADPGNRGKVMNRGLWRYTRHPNYFGDFCVWWGLYVVSLGSGGWWTVFSPIVMGVLLMKVSGVALLEKDIGERRPEYARYIRETSAFWPWWPRW
ncbi:MAG: DUF1295 domain-containing protein [Planctomycetales bacterium]